jgi:hypothetical protein
VKSLRKKAKVTIDEAALEHIPVNAGPAAPSAGPVAAQGAPATLPVALPAAR